MGDKHIYYATEGENILSISEQMLFYTEVLIAGDWPEIKSGDCLIVRRPSRYHCLILHIEGVERPKPPTPYWPRMVLVKGRVYPREVGPLQPVDGEGANTGVDEARGNSGSVGEI